MMGINSPAFLRMQEVTFLKVFLLASLKSSDENPKSLYCLKVFPDMVSCEDYIFRNLLLRKVK